VIREISFNLYYFEWAHTKSKEFNVLVDDLKANSRSKCNILILSVIRKNEDGKWSTYIYIYIGIVFI